jgi:hypothetical protein
MVHGLAENDPHGKRQKQAYRDRQPARLWLDVGFGRIAYRTCYANAGLS